MKEWKACLILRDAWLILGIMLILVLGAELLARTYYLFRNGWKGRAQEQAEIDSFANLDVFRAIPSKQEFLREFVQRVNGDVMDWYPYTYWRSKPSVGQYIQIDSHGIRQTRNFTKPDDAQIKIFVFGGSTTWGYGAQDSYTIPSFMAAKLEELGVRDVYVTNFGQIGYVSTQEVIQLLLELRAGNRPDIVVFYDGVNDTYSAATQLKAGLPYNEVNRQREFNAAKSNLGAVLIPWLSSRSQLFVGMTRLVRKLHPSSDRPMAEGDNSSLNVLAEEVLNAYFANVKVVEALAQTYHFEAYFFWQPTAFSKTPLTAQEIELMQKKHAGSGAVMLIKEGLVRQVYTNLRNSSDKPRNFYDLQNVFDGINETLFFDPTHIGEQGNRLIANAIVEVLLRDSAVLKEGGPTEDKSRSVQEQNGLDVVSSR